MGRGIVKLLNRVTRLRRARCRPGQLLLLIPSCLQSSRCTQNVTNDVAECLRCGRCKVKDVLELADRYGVRCAMAKGGRLALELAGEGSVKAVLAVACEKELQAGLRAVFPKPSLGIINLRPNGPCKDTDVDLVELEDALAWLLRV
jgi:hypothetical protein